MKEVASPQTINIVLLTAGALQGILLSVFLVKRKIKNKLPETILLLLTLVLSVQLLLKVASKLWLLQHVSFWYILSYELPFLYGPLLYLYIMSSEKDRPMLARRDLLHFLPFLFILTSLTLFHYIPDPAFHIFLFEAKVSFAVPHGGLQLLSVIMYGIFSWKIAGNHHGHKTNTLRSGRFIVVSGLVFSFVILTIHCLYYFYPSHQGARFLFFFLTVYIYWISYHVFSRAEIREPAGTDFDSKELPVFEVLTRKEKYVNTRLSPAESDKIKIALMELVEKGKPFLDPLLNLDSLANQLQVQRHQLSQVLNDQLNKSFFDFVNYYRVETAKNFLLDKSKNHFTIAAIAYDSGFNSVSSFNTVFKKYTNQTPSQYRLAIIHVHPDCSMLSAL